MAIFSLKSKEVLSNLTAPANVDPGAMIPIATVTGNGSSSVITFSSIPNTYEHLQIRIFGVSTATYNYIRFNSDTGNNYSWHQLWGDGGSAQAAGGATQPFIYANQFPNSTTYPVASIVDILDYANTNKNKTLRLLTGVDSNGGGHLYMRSGAWYSTSAISTITFTLDSSTYAAGTIYALYGIKRAGA